MSLPYFFEENILPHNENLILSEETGKHCTKVLRMAAGDRLKLTDGKGRLFAATLIKTGKSNCEVSIDKTTYIEQDVRKVCIVISLLKNMNRFELFLEKATEIGVAEIIPLICKRTERQNFRHARMKSILVSAMLQSQRAWLPVLHEPLEYEKLFLQSTAYSQKLIAYCNVDIKLSIAQLRIMNNVQVLIGPEGDFTDDEIQIALQDNYQAVSLGNTRLRTETAGIVAATLLMNC